MKKIFTISTIMLLLCGIMMLLPINKTLAYDWKTQINNADNWGTNNTVVTTTQKNMGTAIRVIRVVGTGISIIMITYVAIKYMSAAPQEKAEFKKSATAYIVGAIVLFASSNILKVISDFATSNIK